eukprot:5143866-Amphidinium_carterae.1
MAKAVSQAMRNGNGIEGSLEAGVLKADALPEWLAFLLGAQSDNELVAACRRHGQQPTWRA